VKIHSWDDYGNGDEKVIFYLEEDTRESRQVFNPMTGIVTVVERGAKIPEDFILTFPWLLAPQIKRALADWLYSQDIRPGAESKAQGKLEATRYHLEDLREILKLHDPHGKEPR
jgi:hypothetical protein